LESGEDPSTRVRRRFEGTTFHQGDRSKWPQPNRLRAVQNHVLLENRLNTDPLHIA